MNEHLAGINLRLTQVQTRTLAPGRDLTSFDAKEYPNGALVLVADSSTLYTLDKNSTVTPNSFSVVAAIGGGNWIALTSGTMPLGGAIIALDPDVGTPSSSPAVTQLTWTALPGGANQYASGSGGVEWSLDLATGVLTYNGPTRSFYFSMSVSARAPSLAPGGLYAFSLSRSNAPILTTVANSMFEAQQQTTDEDEGNWALFGSLDQLVAGQTIQGCFRNINNIDGIVLLRYQLMLIPAP